VFNTTGFNNTANGTSGAAAQYNGQRQHLHWGAGVGFQHNRRPEHRQRIQCAF
jgi:hypothetical protein